MTVSVMMVGQESHVRYARDRYIFYRKTTFFNFNFIYLNLKGHACAIFTTDRRTYGHFLIKELLYYKKSVFLIGICIFFRLICVTTTACQGAVVSSMDTLYVPVLLVILVLGNITFGHTVLIIILVLGNIIVGHPVLCSSPFNDTGAR